MVANSKMLTETEYVKEIDGKKRNQMFRDGRLTLEHQTSSDTDEIIKKTFSESLGERVVDIFSESESGSDSEVSEGNSILFQQK